MDIIQYINTWVQAHAEELTEDICRLVRINSVKGEPEPGMPYGPGPARVLQQALELCAGYGFRVTNYDNYIGAADMGDKPAAVDILCHLDVVDAADGWDTDPYEPVLKEDGCLYGRGASDDKGPAVAALYAMRCIAEAGLPLAGNARLILGCDEESGSSDLEYYYKRARPAPNTFSPDAEFPVYNTEKGRYAPVFSRSWPREEQKPCITRLEGGYRANVLPAEAVAEIAGLTPESCAPLREQAARLGVQLRAEPSPEGVTLYVKGRDAHASTPEEGVNGITALIELLCRLPLAEGEQKKTLLALRELFPHGDGAGRALGIAMADEISGPLTLAFSLLTMDGEGAQGQFDARVPICGGRDNCFAVAERRLREAGFRVTGTATAPHHTPGDSPFVQTLLSAYEQFSGREGACLAMGGGTYVHDVEGGVAFGMNMPGFACNLHGANERISLADTLTAAKIYAKVIYDMCRGDR